MFMTLVSRGGISLCRDCIWELSLRVIAYIVPQAMFIGLRCLGLGSGSLGTFLTGISALECLVSVMCMR